MWSQAVLVCLVLVRSVPVLYACTAYSMDDNKAPTPDMIRREGYKCEIHEVVTEDGYILQVHRIPGGRVKPLDLSLHPVFLQHGLLTSSADWVLSGPNKSLSYILADLGYDVWLGNARGNIYSKAHKTISTNDIRFWNWTWHEKAYYDLPAVLDHILEVSGKPQLHYIGHSMGSTMFFVLCSTRPQYNDKILSMAALAPVAFMGHLTSPIRYLVPYANQLEKIVNFFGAGQFLPTSRFMDKIFKWSCEMLRFQKKICENYLFLICGFDRDQFDEKLLPLILGHNPSGESTKTLVHYAQEIKTNKFQQFDYGPMGNLVIYNSSSPPQYNLSLVTAPISLLYGDNDVLASPVDVNRLFDLLPNQVGLFRVNLTSFNHLDFLWGKDAKTLVYDQVIYLLEKFKDRNVQCVKPKDIKRTGLEEVEAEPCSSCNISSQIRSVSSLGKTINVWKNLKRVYKSLSIFR